MKMKLPPSWKFLFGMWVAQGMACLLWLFLIPTDAENGIFLGFTMARLLLIGTMLALVVISTTLFFYERFPIYAWFNDEQRKSKLWDISYLLGVIVVVVTPALMRVLHSLGGPQYTAYAERLTPLAVWFWLSSLELVLYSMYLRYEQGTHLWNGFKPVTRIFWSVLAVLFVIVLGVAFTKIGITPDYNMGAPAIPLFEWQVGLILLILVAFAFVSARNIERLDRWVAPCIYVFTVLLWLSQPITTAYTATPPRAPNFEIYPFSDPQIYSQYAQAALVGNGFAYPDVPSRPLYIALLTWFYLLGNQKYELVVIIQTLMLAFYPVMLYLIGRELGGRALGFGLAVMAVFRDLNSNATVLFASNVTYSKLLLSEMPLALFLGLFVLILIRWLKRSPQSTWMPILAGSVLGGAALIRTQSLALVAIVALFGFLMIPVRKQWLKGMVIFSFALAATLLPWLTRNYIAAGGFVLDNPVSQVMTMARRWSGSWGNEMIPMMAGETNAEYSSRMTKLAIEAFKRDPQFILKTAANHFINSEIASLMVLPLRDEVLTPSELFLPQHAFWRTTLAPYQLPLFAIYLILFGLGVAVAIRQHQWLGVLPLSLGLTYNVWTAIFFSSGERFIAPLDWTVYFYQFLGLIAVGTFFLSFTQGGYEHASSLIRGLSAQTQAFTSPETSSRRNLVFVLIVSAFLAGFTPITEFIFPQKYQPLTVDEFEQKTNIDVKEGETIISGRATYPRYYAAGDGEPETAKIGYGEAEEARLVFYVVGTENTLVVFELEDVPQFFPHASDIYLVGTWSEKGYFSPRVAMVSLSGNSEIYQSSR